MSLKKYSTAKYIDRSGPRPDRVIDCKSLKCQPSDSDIQWLVYRTYLFNLNHFIGKIQQFIYKDIGTLYRSSNEEKKLDG